MMNNNYNDNNGMHYGDDSSDGSNDEPHDMSKMAKVKMLEEMQHDSEGKTKENLKKIVIMGDSDEALLEGIEKAEDMLKMKMGDKFHDEDDENDEEDNHEEDGNDSDDSEMLQRLMSLKK